jgi:Skp family chaperone for outer membrane proteins
MRRNVIGLAIVAMGVIAWTTSRSFIADRPAGAVAASNKIAVVDLVRVFNEFKQTKALNAKMMEYRKALTDEKDQKQQKVNALREQLESFAPDSADYYKRREELTRLRIDLEVWQGVKLDELGEHHLRWIKRTYQMVTDEVAALAKLKGVDLVVTREEMDTPNTSDTSKLMQATLQQILNRKVVYSDPMLDITEEVLKRLDAGFEKRGGEKALDPKK